MKASSVPATAWGEGCTGGVTERRRSICEPRDNRICDVSQRQEFNAPMMLGGSGEREERDDCSVRFHVSMNDMEVCRDVGKEVRGNGNE